MAPLLELLRAILGVAFVLIAPGLAWTFLFWPYHRPVTADGGDRGLDPIERAGLGMVLSLALVPAAFLLANWLLRIPIVLGSAAAILAFLIAVPLVAAAWLRRRRTHRGTVVPGPESGLQGP
jgi:uncharacterized membrane protein